VVSFFFSSSSPLLVLFSSSISYCSDGMLFLGSLFLWLTSVQVKKARVLHVLS